MHVDPKTLYDEHGQSLWLDGLRRRLVLSGELARRIEQGVRGVVGSVEHLDAALAGAGDYDDDLRRLVAESHSVPEILEELLVSDARSAADALRALYDASSEIDGWVCIDVPTAAADDTAALVAEGVRMVRAVGRDNVMVRVPATPEGCQALTELIALGVPTAAGLVFGPAQHLRVTAAYLLGLEQRAGRGEPISQLSSIVCVEVGALDLAASHRLRERALSSPGAENDPSRGAGLALARSVLADQHELEESPRYSELSAAGARPQRIAWSSTVAHDARIAETRWVDALVAPDTVSVVSLTTLTAFVDRGRIEPLDTSLDSENGLERMRKLGIDLDPLAEELLDQAVSARQAGIARLLEVIEARREALLEQAAERQRISLGAASEPVVTALRKLNESDAAQRLWHGDPSLFGTEVDATAIKSRIGWLRLTQMMRAQIDDLETFARTQYRAGLRKALVLGMGGSSSAAAAVAAIYGATPGFLELAVLDSTDPVAVRRAEAWADLDTTLLVVASKSGSTLETECLESYFFEKLEARHGERAGQRCVAITDPGTPLAERATARRYARAFLCPPDVGGRYSALSYFGLVPAALCGADVRALLEDAQRMTAGCAPFVPADDNPGLRLGAFVGALAKAGRDKLTLILSPEVRGLGVVIEQLLTESTGKQERGVVVIADEPLGGPDAYGKDRAFVYVRYGSRQPTDLDRDVEALALAGFPVARIGMLARHDLGGELFRWQVATVIAGSVLELNPFDEPNVAEAKHATQVLLEELELTGQLPAAPAHAPGDPAIAKLVRDARPGEWVALLPYLAQTDERDRDFAGVRAALRDRLGIASTLGYGPRYLHGAGQLYKAGPSGGIFLLITAEGDELPIPGKNFGFASLSRAQALGDLATLKRRGRRALHVHLGPDAKAGLTTLCRQLAAL